MSRFDISRFLFLFSFSFLTAAIRHGNAHSNLADTALNIKLATKIQTLGLIPCTDMEIDSALKAKGSAYVRCTELNCMVEMSGHNCIANQKEVCNKLSPNNKKSLFGARYVECSTGDLSAYVMSADSHETKTVCLVGRCNIGIADNGSVVVHNFENYEVGAIIPSASYTGTIAPGEQRYFDQVIANVLPLNCGNTTVRMVYSLSSDARCERRYNNFLSRYICTNYELVHVLLPLILLLGLYYRFNPWAEKLILSLIFALLALLFVFWVSGMSNMLYALYVTAFLVIIMATNKLNIAISTVTALFTSWITYLDLLLRKSLSSHICCVCKEYVMFQHVHNPHCICGFPSFEDHKCAFWDPGHEPILDKYNIPYEEPSFSYFDTDAKELHSILLERRTGTISRKPTQGDGKVIMPTFKHVLYSRQSYSYATLLNCILYVAIIYFALLPSAIAQETTTVASAETTVTVSTVPDPTTMLTTLEPSTLGTTVAATQAPTTTTSEPVTQSPAGKIQAKILAAIQSASTSSISPMAFILSNLQISASTDADEFLENNIIAEFKTAGITYDEMILSLTRLKVVLDDNLTIICSNYLEGSGIVPICSMYPHSLVLPDFNKYRDSLAYGASDVGSVSYNEAVIVWVASLLGVKYNDLLPANDKGVYSHTSETMHISIPKLFYPEVHSTCESSSHLCDLPADPIVSCNTELVTTGKVARNMTIAEMLQPTVYTECMPDWPSVFKNWDLHGSDMPIPSVDCNAYFHDTTYAYAYSVPAFCKNGTFFSFDFDFSVMARYYEDIKVVINCKSLGNMTLEHKSSADDIEMLDASSSLSIVLQILYLADQVSVADECTYSFSIVEKQLQKSFTYLSTPLFDHLVSYCVHNQCKPLDVLYDKPNPLIELRTSDMNELKVINMSLKTEPKNLLNISKIMDDLSIELLGKYTRHELLRFLAQYEVSSNLPFDKIGTNSNVNSSISSRKIVSPQSSKLDSFANLTYFAARFLQDNYLSKLTQEAQEPDYKPTTESSGSFGYISRGKQIKKSLEKTSRETEPARLTPGERSAANTLIIVSILLLIAIMVIAYIIPFVVLYKKFLAKMSKDENILYTKMELKRKRRDQQVQQANYIIAGEDLERDPKGTEKKEKWHHTVSRSLGNAGSDMKKRFIIHTYTSWAAFKKAIQFGTIQSRTVKYTGWFFCLVSIILLIVLVPIVNAQELNTRDADKSYKSALALNNEYSVASSTRGSAVLYDTTIVLKHGTKTKISLQSPTGSELLGNMQLAVNEMFIDYKLVILYKTWKTSGSTVRRFCDCTKGNFAARCTGEIGEIYGDPIRKGCVLHTNSKEQHFSGDHCKVTTFNKKLMGDMKTYCDGMCSVCCIKQTNDLSAEKPHEDQATVYIIQSVDFVFDYCLMTPQGEYCNKLIGADDKIVTHGRYTLKIPAPAFNPTSLRVGDKIVEHNNAILTGQVADVRERTSGKFGNPQAYYEDSKFILDEKTLIDIELDGNEDIESCEHNTFSYINNLRHIDNVVLSKNNSVVTLRTFEVSDRSLDALWTGYGDAAGKYESQIRSDPGYPKNVTVNAVMPGFDLADYSKPENIPAKKDKSVFLVEEVGSIGCFACTAGMILELEITTTLHGPIEYKCLVETEHTVIYVEKGKTQQNLTLYTSDASGVCNFTLGEYYWDLLYQLDNATTGNHYDNTRLAIIDRAQTGSRTPLASFINGVGNTLVNSPFSWLNPFSWLPALWENGLLGKIGTIAIIASLVFLAVLFLTFVMPTVGNIFMAGERLGAIFKLAKKKTPEVPTKAANKKAAASTGFYKLD